MALHHFAISLCDTQVDATETNHDEAHSLTPFSRRQVAAEVPMFASFATRMSSFFFVSFRRRRHRHLLCLQGSNNHNQSPQEGPKASVKTDTHYGGPRSTKPGIAHHHQLRRDVHSCAWVRTPFQEGQCEDPSCTARRNAARGAVSALPFERPLRNCAVSSDQRPPVSAASTTKRARPSSPTDSG